MALPGTVTVSGVPEARYSTTPPLALLGVWPAIRKSFNFKESLQPQKKEEGHGISMGQSQSVKSMHDGICLKTLAFSPLVVRAADAYAGNKP